jgi:hypothetical protein
MIVMAKGGQTGKGGGSAAMKAAWKLYDAGDKVLARQEARKVLESGSPSEADASEARELLERTAPPRLFRGLAVLAASLIALLVLLTLLRGS